MPDLHERVHALENAVLALGHLEFVGDVPGHPFHGNQWRPGGSGDENTLGGRYAGKGTDAGRVPRQQVAADLVQAALKAGLSTDDRFENGSHGPHGHWAPERELLHQKIVDEILKENAHVPKDARAVIMGGLPGSGKSSMLESSTTINAKDFVTINPDDIKERLIAHDALPDHPLTDGLKPMETAALIHEESSKIAYDLATRASADGTNVIWDITMNSAGQAAKRIDELKDDTGPAYHVTALFSDVTTEVAKERAMGRYTDAMDTPQGGRYVSPHIIDEAYDPTWGSRNRAAFEAVKPTVDSWQLWDNNGAKSVMADKGP